jgi:LysM repeat protein
MVLCARTLVLFSTIFLSVMMIRPPRAEAGFFDNVFKFFGGESQAAVIDAPLPEGFSMPLLGSDRAPVANGPVQDDTVLATTQDNALVSSRNPLGILPPTPGAGQIVVYTVQAGDTPGAIATRFGISLNTLLWANDLRSAGSIRIGDSLIILPVTGVQYTIKKGDTIESIAKKFAADSMDIMSFNGLAVGESLVVDTEIIIPDGEVAAPPSPSAPSRPAQSSATRFAGLPEMQGFLMRPVTGGRNPRATRANPHGLHGYNGVDLANSCGLPVSAAAAGSVIIVRTSGWNGGYGKYVVISHPNGVQTLYAHMSALNVNAGDAVAQGTRIGLIGSTGNSTGCHVHFEVRGAKNPF